jgi:outer membrane protein OmpA-like peptidoglycan-associated protein
MGRQGKVREFAARPSRRLYNMALEYAGVNKHFARAIAIAVLAFGTSACSVMPDWLGGDSAPAPTAEDQADQQAVASAATPDLSGVPDKPAAASTPDAQKELSDSLGAARAQNQYSSDALRGGTEAPAAPPGPPSTDQVAEVATTPQQTPDGTPAPAPQPAAPAASSDSGSIDTAAAAGEAPAAPAAPASSTSAPTASVATAEQPAPPSGGEPAVPAVPDAPESRVSSMIAPSDAALGFKPSMAPPLDPTVAQFVPQPVIARYQQTASMSGMAGVGSYSETASSGGKAMGGPEHMSGAVVANFDSLQGGGMPSVYAGGGGSPSAVVFFSGDTTILNPKARQEIRAAAAAFQQSGAQGYVRVVGHSDSTGSKMSAERRLVWDLERSQARATAVARELIRDGVPASKVLVQAAGSGQSGYYEGVQDSSRTAEIFLQS